MHTQFLTICRTLKQRLGSKATRVISELSIFSDISDQRVAKCNCSLVVSSLLEKKKSEFFYDKAVSAEAGSENIQSRPICTKQDAQMSHESIEI